MGFYRYILLILEDEERKYELLSEIPNWEYNDKIENDLRAAGFSFTLINKEENIQVYFKKIKDCVYTSMNVLPYNIVNQSEIVEPQAEDIHNDILFKLCISIRRKYVNLELRCGIVPCDSDEFKVILEEKE